MAINNERHRYHANGLSRRDFLKHLIILGGACIVRPETFRISLEEAGTGREQQEISWPEDLRGNESFLGGNIFITIDDCQFPSHVRSMFDTLQAHRATATFFPNTVYQRTDDVYRLWREIYAAGNDIGYHTTNHDFGIGSASSNWTVDQLHRDFDLFTSAMRNILDDSAYEPKFARPPYGVWNRAWMTFVRERGLTNVRWNFVPDAKNNSLRYFDAVMRHPQGGRIVLLHTRQWDTQWLHDNIFGLQEFAGRDGGALVSFRHLR